MVSLMQKAIFKTISYADVFDYPLTLDEIKRWLIKVKNQKSKIKSLIKYIKLINEKDGFYFLKGREDIVKERIKREKYSQEKFKMVQEIIKIIKLIPTIKLIGITGALAMRNGKEKDDIDLFIITSSGLLWTTRLLSTFLVEITGMRRHPQEKNVNNKICLNMFIDESNLEIPPKEKDLFSAHEVLQMQPLISRDNTYQKFLTANIWVGKYLPNAIEGIKYKVSSIKYKDNKSNLMEKIFKQLQLWYMKDKRTTEVIKEGVIRFHPKDAREWVMREYNKRLKNI